MGSLWSGGETLLRRGDLFQWEHFAPVGCLVSVMRLCFGDKTCYSWEILPWQGNFFRWGVFGQVVRLAPMGILWSGGETLDWWGNLHQWNYFALVESLVQWCDFAVVRRLAPVERYCSGRNTFSGGASLVRWEDLLQWEVFDLVGRLCSSRETCSSGNTLL